MRKFTHRKDLVILTALLALSLAVWLARALLFPAGAPAVARILYQGDVVLECPLDMDGTISISQRPQVVLKVQDGGCAFVASDCPDKVCIHAGYQSRPGQSAACLPNGMVLQIVAGHGDDGDRYLDAVLR